MGSFKKRSRSCPAWEISIKHKKRLLLVPEDMDSIITEAGFKALPISVFHGEKAGDLPLTIAIALTVCSLLRLNQRGCS
jgi:hypothetical protein